MHEIDESTGKAAMAFVDQVPWHGLGQQLKKGAALEEWMKAAGMDFELKACKLEATFGKQKIEVPDFVSLVRSDTKVPLSIVGDRYKIVQPKGVLEFFRDLVSDQGMSLETAGVLKGGRRYWALAKTGVEAKVLNKVADPIKAYVLLSTSCDGSLSTRAAFTSVRVVCQNTLNFSLSETNKSKAGKVSVKHSTEFDPLAVKMELGLVKESFHEFMSVANTLAKVKVKDQEAKKFFLELFSEDIKTVDLKKELAGTPAKLMLCYQKAPGADLITAQGTAWGLVNAVTRYYDHERSTRSTDARLNRSWFGDGNRMKKAALDAALLLAA